MSYANVQSSGKLETGSGAGVSWSPGSPPTVNNLLSGRFWGFTSGNYTPGVNDVKDSSGTPKTFNLDVPGTVEGGSNVSIYTLIVPSGLTSPLKNVNTAAVLAGVMDEWSGNATSSVLDQTNHNQSASNVTSGTSGSITTGANAGLVLSVVTQNGNSSNLTITTTGTSFTRDVSEVSNTTFQAGAADHRTASVSSVTLNDAWTFSTTGSYSAVIASYNALPSSVDHPVSISVVTRGGITDKALQAINRSIAVAISDFETAAKGLGKPIAVDTLPSETATKALGKAIQATVLDATPVSRQASLSRAVVASTSHFEASARTVAYGRALTSKIPFASTAARSIGYTRSIVASLPVSSVIARSAAYIRPITTATTGAITLARAAAYSRSIVAAEAISQPMVGLKTKLVSFAVSVRGSQAITRSATYTRSIAQSVACTDSVSRVTGLSRSIVATALGQQSVAGSSGHTGTNFPRAIASTILPSIQSARQAAYGRAIQVAEVSSVTLSRSVGYGRSVASHVRPFAVLSATKTKLVTIAAGVTGRSSVARSAGVTRSVATTAPSGMSLARGANNVTRSITSVIRHVLSLVGLHGTPAPDAIFTAQVRSKNFASSSRSLTMAAEVRSKTFTARKQP